MADVAIHEKQAKHNFKLALKLAKNEFRDWAAISSFYSALHFIETKFINNPKIGHTEHLYEKMKLDTTTSEEIKHKSVHAFREMLVGSEYPTIRTKFGQLWHLSEAARYLDTTGNKCAFDYISNQVIKRAIDDLKAIVAKVS